jgi:hypothetical protein
MAYFQSNEMLIPYHQVCLVEKHPPDRLDILLTTGDRVTLLNEDCKPFYQQYVQWLNG